MEAFCYTSDMKMHESEHIGIRLLSDQFEVLSNYDGNFKDVYAHIIDKIQKSLEDPFNPSYPFLTTIDEYDNTFYNWYQVLKLTNELKQLANNDEDVEFKSAVEKVVEYLNTTSSLRYIQFVGD
jgi:hypothetical protein